MTHPGMRYTLLVIGILSAIVAVGYFLQMPWALATCPWQDGRLSNTFT